MTLAAHRPGRATAGWSFLISSFVVTRTMTRRPWPIRPSTTLRKRDRPCPVRPRVRAQEFAGVLHDEQPPEAIVSLFLVGVLLEPVHHASTATAWPSRSPPTIIGNGRPEEHRHQVVRVLAEERVRIDDVVDLAPVAPLPGERAQRERLAGPLRRARGRADRRGQARSRASGRRAGAGARGVVRRDLVPRRARRSAATRARGPCGAYIQNVTGTSCAELGSGGGKSGPRRSTTASTAARSVPAAETVTCDPQSCTSNRTPSSSNSALSPPCDVVRAIGVPTPSRDFTLVGQLPERISCSPSDAARSMKIALGSSPAS